MKTMNDIERTVMHALFYHPHHNTDKIINFGLFTELNNKVNLTYPGLILVGPADNDDAGVFRIPGTNIILVKKTESHCSPTAQVTAQAASYPLLLQWYA